MCFVMSDSVSVPHGLWCTKPRLPSCGSQRGDDHAVRLQLLHVGEVVLTTHLAVVTAVFDLLRHINPCPGGSI